MLTLMLQISTAVQIRDKFVGHHTLNLMEIAFQKLISQVLVNLNHVQKIHIGIIINTIFVIMRKNAHFETTVPTIAGKNSRIVVEGKETIFDLATNKMPYEVPM